MAVAGAQHHKTRIGRDGVKPPVNEQNAMDLDRAGQLKNTG